MALNTGDAEFEAMIASPAFKKLGSLPNGRALQKQAVTEWKQKKRMKIPKAEGVLQNAINVVKDVGRNVDIATNALVNTATFGAADATGKLIEKALPTPPGMYNPTRTVPSTDPGTGLGALLRMMVHPVDFRENIAQGVGSAAGFTAGGPGQIYNQGVKLVEGMVPKTAGMIPKVIAKLGGSSLGGGASAFSAPGSLKERTSSIPVGMALGPAFEAGLGALKLGGKVVDTISGKRLKPLRANVQKTGGDIYTADQEIKDIAKKIEGMKSAEKIMSRAEPKMERMSAEESSAQASQAVKSKVSERFKQARDNWTRMRENLDPSSVTMQDLLNTLDNVLTEKGISSKMQFPQQAEKELLRLRRKVDSYIPKPQKGQPAKPAPEIEDPIVFKNITDEVFDAVSGRTDLEGSWLRHFEKTLTDKGMSDYLIANLGYRGAYESAEAARGLPRGKYRAAGIGKLTPTDEASMLASEGKVGVNYLKDIIKKQKQRRLEQSQLRSERQKEVSSLQSQQSQLKQIRDLMDERLKELNQKLADQERVTQTARKYAINTGLGLGGLATIQKALSALVGRRE